MKKILFVISILFCFFSYLFAGAFHDAIYKCDIAKVKQYIELEVDVNQRNDNLTHITPLGIVLKGEGLKTINCGKGKNADRKMFQMIKLLVKNGADVNLNPATSREHTPIYTAFECKSYAIQCYNFLIKEGADIKHTSNELLSEYNSLNWFIIMIQINKKNVPFKNSFYLPIVKYLLEKGLNPNLMMQHNSAEVDSTALDIAFEIGDIKLIKLLKIYGAKTKAQLDKENY